ncbi:MAG: immunoglobulin domain-containing protein, partial [Bacteroidota bacterium]
DDFLYKIGIQSTGRIVASGYCNNGSYHDVSMACYNTDGSLYTGFSGDGKYNFSISEGSDYSRGMVIQPDDKIVVAGYAYYGDNRLIMARVNVNGTLDAGFGSSGTVIANNSEYIENVFIQPDGKLVLTGDNFNDFIVIRYNTIGSRDNTFGSSGKVTTAVTPSSDISITGMMDGWYIFNAGSCYNGAYDAAITKHYGCIEPYFTSMPVDETVCEGENASFTAVATGSTPLTYQWYDMMLNPVGTNSMIYSITSATTANSGMYYCEVTNACGSMSSDYANLTVYENPMVDAGMDAEVCDGDQTILSAMGGDIFDWSDGVMQDIPFIPTSTNTYTVTATDIMSGCTATDDVLVTVNPLPNAFAGNDQTVCEGAEAILSATGGDMYSWSDGIMQDMPFYPTSNMTYTVTVINSSTYCMASDDVDITVVPSPFADAGMDQQVCEEDYISLSATASGGTGTYSYLWDNGIQQGVPFQVFMMTTYTVTVTDDNNCTSTDDVYVDVLLKPFADPGMDQTICFGDVATLTASGGDDYIWDNGVIQDVPFYPSTTTTYTVTVSYASGCYDIASVTIFVDLIPVVDAGTNQTVCANNADVTLSGSVSDATGAIWSGGFGYFSPDSYTLNAVYTPSAAEISSGVVTLTLTSFGSGECSDVSDDVTITFTPAPTVFAGTDLYVCESSLPVSLNGSVTIAAGGIWSGGIGTFSPNNTALNATYTPDVSEIGMDVTLTLTTTGNNNCNPVSDDITIYLTPAPTVYAGADQSVCEGNPAITLDGIVSNAASTIWSGGTGTYNPNNTSLNAIYNPSMAEITNGVFTLTLSATGFGSCTGVVTDQVVVVINPNPYVGIDTIINTSCYGSCTGSAVVFGIGGTAPYSYSWSASAGGSTDSVATYLCAGYHYVTVVDDNGCYANESIEVTEPNELNVSVSNVIPNTCYSGHDGVINTSVTGGTSPYTYLWSNGAITPNNSGLIAGNYSVTVIDANGCSSILYNIAVGQPPQIQVYINTTNAMCNQSDGTATATVTGGTSPYSYLWSNMTTINPAIDLSAGSYSLIVTDNNGCIKTKYFSISNSGGFTLSANITDADCFGDNSGAIDMNISGGTAPFTISWSSGESTEDLTNLVAGAYDVIVTDYNNCMGMETFEVQDGVEINFSTSVNNPTCSQTDGSITITPSGGLSPYTYEWSNGASSYEITGLAAGSYFVTITDANSCSADGMISLANTGGPVITIDSLISASCGGNGSAYISVTGGTSPYTFVWSDLSTNEDIENVSPGNYSVSVSEQGGCMTVENLIIPIVQLPVQPICVVTVDTMLGRNLIVWEKVSTSGVDFYKIYRETSIPDQYHHVGTVDYDSMSEYLDAAANPFVRSWRYKITAVDMCGNESPLSYFHKTLHLTMNQGMGMSYNLIWDDYEGFTYYSFIIQRYLPSLGWVTLDTLPKTLHSYTDSPPSTTGISYLVSIVAPNPCIPTSSAKANGGPYSHSYSNLEDEGVISLISGLSQTGIIEIYPNPMDASTTIFFDNFDKNRKVIISDISGKILRIYEYVYDNILIIERGNLTPGMYLVDIVGEKSFKAKLIIK